MNKLVTQYKRNPFTLNTKFPFEVAQDVPKINVEKLERENNDTSDNHFQGKTDYNQMTFRLASER